MLHYSGYNIGAFSLPFVQNFFGASAVVVISMFNMGSSMMTAGGTNAIVAAVSDSPEKESGFKAFKKMFSTLAFNICILLLILSLTGIRLPSFVLSAASLVGSANGFLSMLAIGMMLEVNFDTKRIGQAAKTLGARYLSATVFSLLIYFCLPFSLEIRQVLTLAVFSPVSALAPAFIEKNKGDVALSSVTSSLSILVSIPIMLLLLILNEL
ncbi:hypothetical protein U6B65_07075 [Oscillospiraceae bacterium MB08-C2-2]|nr:hypothetical protein U6B65_07075 [Oscillospiraceae bacterium MB08-C2-2]